MARGLGLGEVNPGTPGRFSIEWWHDSPLLPAEHVARAMLLGRYYNPVMHDYRINQHGGDMKIAGPIDADTLDRYTVSRKKYRDRFQMENGLTETQMTLAVQAAYHGRIAYPAKFL